MANHSETSDRAGFDGLEGQDFDESYEASSESDGDDSSESSDSEESSKGNGSSSSSASSSSSSSSSGSQVPAELEDVPLDDPAALERLYYREMSMIPLPSRERELEMATRIDAARDEIRKLVLKPPKGLKRTLGAYERLRNEGHEIIDPCPDQLAEQLVEELREALYPRPSEALKKAGNAREVSQFLRKLGLAVHHLNLAKDALTESNLRLVIHIANRYRQNKLPLMDLIQEGNLGLMKAVEKFDVSRGYRFSTYAVWWIRQYIKRALENYGDTVRMPIYVQDARRRVMRTSRELRRKLGRKPEAWEIAQEEGIPVDKVEDLFGLSTAAVSLDEPVSSRVDRPLEEVLADTKACSPFDSAADSELTDAVQNALGSLPPREATILRLRFGIGVDDPAGQTLREIGRQFNLTHERIRQIEARALQRLRDTIESQRLEAHATD